MTNNDESSQYRSCSQPADVDFSSTQPLKQFLLVIVMVAMLMLVMMVVMVSIVLTTVTITMMIATVASVMMILIAMSMVTMAIVMKIIALLIMLMKESVYGFSTSNCKFFSYYFLANK